MSPVPLSSHGRVSAGSDRSHEFDPITGFCAAQDSRPGAVRTVDPATLSPFQRALLVTDGTVTRFLEAYALEPVAVLRLEQEQLALAAADAWLELPEGAPVIRRRVVLRGEVSGRFFTWADSVIAVERLPRDMCRALDIESGGLGKILLDSALDTRREGLWWGREHPAAVPEAVAKLWDGEFLIRAYRVLAGREPLMLITERFPL